MQHLPADILERIELEFDSEQDRCEVLELLLELDKRGYLNETFRIERCLLFGTNGNIDTLRRNIGFDDYRDIILYAEYEGDEQVRDLNFPFGSAERYHENDEYPGPPDDFPF